MPMKRKAPWVDFIMYGAFSLLGLAGLICALIFDPSLGALIASGAAFLGFLTVFIAAIFTWYFSKPDYITKHGTAVWIDKLAVITQDSMEAALDFYIENLPKYSPISISSDQLAYMLHDACIEWSAEPVSSLGIGWAVKDKAGLQMGRNVKVHWTGSIISSALYHELLHMVDEIVLAAATDYKHERTEWWAIIIKLKNDFVGQR